MGDVIAPASVDEAAAVLAERWNGRATTVVADHLSHVSGDASIVVVSTRHLARIVNVDPENGVIVAEAGVPVGRVREAAGAVGLWCPALRWLPPDGTIGAAIAAGHGRRSIRYGSTVDYVLGARFACPAVGPVRHGGKAIKNATGYNLSGLVAGSRGQLGVILELILRLVPLPRRWTIYMCRASSPEALWPIAQRVIDDSNRSPPNAGGSSVGPTAVEVWISFSSGRGAILVEREGSAPWAPSVRDQSTDLSWAAFDQLSPNTAVWPPEPWPASERSLHLAFDRAYVADGASQIALAAARHFGRGALVAELSGGAVDVAIEATLVDDDDLRSKLRLPPGPSASQVRQAIKSAFDPRDQLRSLPLDLKVKPH